MSTNQTDEQVLDQIRSRGDAIKTLLTDEDVDVYLFLLNRFNASNMNVASDPVFQFVYRSYYRLDLAGLSKDFKRAYFQILSGASDVSNSDLKGMCRELVKYKNLKSQHSLQFSFATKLVAMVDPDLPIFDLYVGKTFGFANPGPSIEKRLDILMAFYDRLCGFSRWLPTQIDYQRLDADLCRNIVN